MFDKYSKFKDRELRKNAEGYSDPTAYKAIKKADSDAESKHFYRTLGCIFRVCELAGFDLHERIVLRDKKTGKIWR